VSLAAVVLRLLPAFLALFLTCFINAFLDPADHIFNSMFPSATKSLKMKERNGK
jgi:hypothetical protein